MIYLPLSRIDRHRLDGLINPLIPAIAQALKVDIHGGADQLLQLLTNLHDKHSLLIIDNFDQLFVDRRFPESADLIGTLLQGGPRIEILIVTSRRLRIENEWVLPLRGLPYPEEETGSSLLQMAAQRARFGAIALFADRACRVRADFEITASYAAIVQICRLVKGLPLGIELAAGWVDQLSCEELAHRIEAHIAAIPASSSRQMAGRYRGIPALFNMAWERFSPSERKALRQLSQIAGPFIDGSDGRTAGIYFDLLPRLTRRGLLQPLPDDRYLLHPLFSRLVGEISS